MPFVKDIKGTYRCDTCKETFTAQEVKLEPAGTNIRIETQYMMGVDKEGNVIACHVFKDGDKILHCPKCGYIHLFGFDRVK